MAAELEVAITRAPNIWANCSAKIETPPEPCTSTMSPALMLPISTSACQAVTPAQGSVAPSSKLEAGGQLHHAVLLQHGELGQHAVDGAAHGRGLRRLVDRAADPLLHEAAGDPVADLDRG